MCVLVVQANPVLAKLFSYTQIQFLEECFSYTRRDMARPSDVVFCIAEGRRPMHDDG